MNASQNTAIQPVKTHSLIDFSDRWQLDGDYIRCLHCRQSQQAQWMHHDFLHADRCLCSGRERKPWRTLSKLIAAERVTAKKH